MLIIVKRCFTGCVIVCFAVIIVFVIYKSDVEPQDDNSHKVAMFWLTDAMSVSDEQANILYRAIKTPDIYEVKLRVIHHIDSLEEQGSIVEKIYKVSGDGFDFVVGVNETDKTITTIRRVNK